MRVLLFMLAVLVTAAVYAGDKTNAPAIESFFIRGKVIQVMDDGILIEGSRFRFEDRQFILSLNEKLKVMRKEEKAMPDGKALPDGSSEKTAVMLKKLDATQKLLSFTQSLVDLDEKTGRKGTYFITGITNNLADEEKWSGTVYYVDLYQYISVSGAKKTVRRYSTSQNERNAP